MTKKTIIWIVNRKYKWLILCLVFSGGLLSLHPKVTTKRFHFFVAFSDRNMSSKQDAASVPKRHVYVNVMLGQEIQDFLYDDG